jgi:hypothetical protein
MLDCRSAKVAHNGSGIAEGGEIEALQLGKYTKVH